MSRFISTYIPPHVRTADGLVRCGKCGQPSANLVYRTRWVEDDTGVRLGTVGADRGLWCVECDKEADRE